MSIYGPYQVEDIDVSHRGTLTRRDIGRWYLLINGSMQFYGKGEKGRRAAEFSKAVISTPLPKS